MISFLGATVVILDQQSRVLLKEENGVWSVVEGKVKFRDGISKFTALRLLKEDFGIMIPRTPEYLLRVEYVSNSFVPYKQGDEQALFLNDIYVFQLNGDERLIDFLHTSLNPKFRWTTYAHVLNNANKLSISTLITLNKIYERIYSKIEKLS